MNALELSPHDCPRCESPVERGDLRCAVCSHAVREPAVEVEKPRANVVRCSDCGACVAYDVKAQAPQCAFCGSVTHVESIEDPVEQAEATLAFRVAPDQAKAALSEWWGTRGFFTPSDLKKESTVAELEPLWWPAWVFDAQLDVTWAADSNAGARRSDWAPHSGRLREGYQNVVVSASRGLSEKECLQLIPSTVLSTSDEPGPGPDGAVTELFDVARSSARQRVLAAVDALAEKSAAADVPGSRYRNLKVSTVLSGLRSQRISIPTYVLAYRYRGDLYRALVHGQDLKKVLGSTPTSWLKVALVAAAAVAGVALVIALVTR